MSGAPGLFIAGLIASQPAPETPEAWLFTVEALTEVPHSAGARAQVMGPGRWTASMSLGVLPRPYVALINDAVVGLGGYNEATAQVIESSLSSSAVFRLHGGWSPWSDHGFYLSGGYTLITLGGGVGGAEVVSAAASVDIDAPMGSRKAEFDIRSTLHQVGIEAGWTWRFENQLSARVSLGFIGTLSASSTVEPKFTPLLPGSTQIFSNAVARYLDDIYTTYVFTPVIGVALGYDFTYRPAPRDHERERMDRDLPLDR